MAVHTRPRPETAWGRAAVDLLDDGRWHDYEAVVSVMRAAVPTEVAVHTLSDRGLRSGDMAVDVGRGRRLLATEALQRLGRNGRLVRRVDRYGAVELRRAWK